MMTTAKNRICLWYDGDAEEAARFYASLFPDSAVDAVHRDRRQPDLLQEGQRGHQVVELLGEDRAADLDHGEALGIDLREALEVLLDLLGAGHVREQPNDDRAQLAANFHGR